MEKKSDEKKGSEASTKEAGPEAVKEADKKAGAGTDNKAGSGTGKEADKEATVPVRFVNTYTGVKGNFYAGREYDLAPELYEVFRNDCEKRG